MSIQESINRGLQTGALILTQTPGFSELGNVNRKAQESYKGLKDLEDNFNRIESGKKKPYSDVELSNIEARVNEYNKNIQDAKVNKLLHPIVGKDPIPQEELSPLLEGISNYITSNRSKSMEALKKADDKKEEVLELEKIKNGRFVNHTKSLRKYKYGGNK